ncbi:hypothetical protein BDR26DRAFT_854146 [Obelidium mucronatum]|nr:hypothetical protein BDR26DRAFT_854146 [Obelidium mucronatum]
MSEAAVEGIFSSLLGDIPPIEHQIGAGSTGSIPLAWLSSPQPQFKEQLPQSPLQTNNQQQFFIPSHLGTSDLCNPLVPSSTSLRTVDHHKLRRIINPTLVKPTQKAIKRITPSQLMTSSPLQNAKSEVDFTQLFSPIATQIEQQTPQTFALSNFVPSPMMSQNLEAEIMGFSPQQFGFSTPFIGPFKVPEFTASGSNILASPMMHRSMRSSSTSSAGFGSSNPSPFFNRATPFEMMNAVAAMGPPTSQTPVNRAFESPSMFMNFAPGQRSLLPSNSLNVVSDNTIRNNSEPIVFGSPRPSTSVSADSYSTPSTLDDIHDIEGEEVINSFMPPNSNPSTVDSGVANAKSQKATATKKRRAKKGDGPSDRREYRKEAEKQRRDMMREGFETIKVLVHVEDKTASKEQVLSAALDCITELQRLELEKEAQVFFLEQEVTLLRSGLGI